MAKLEELFTPHFTDMTPAEQLDFISTYRSRREKDLLIITEYTKKRRVSNLNDADRAMMKALGLSQKDLKTLQEMSAMFGPDSIEENDEESDDTDTDTPEEDLEEDTGD